MNLSTLFLLYFWNVPKVWYYFIFPFILLIQIFFGYFKYVKILIICQMIIMSVIYTPNKRRGTTLWLTCLWHRKAWIVLTSTLSLAVYQNILDGVYICWYNAWQWYQDINVEHTCIYNTQIQHYIAWEHQTFLLLNITITRSFLFMEFVRCYVSELVIVYILHIKLMFMLVVRWSLYVSCLFIYVVLGFVVCYDKEIILIWRPWNALSPNPW